MPSLLKNIRVETPPVVQLAQERCLRRRLNSCECHECLDVCTSGALVLAGRQLEFDPRKCTGCMCCTAACPNDAMAGDCDVEELLRSVQARTSKQVVISCIRNKQLSAEEITVPCLGIFAGESLLALGMSGCSSIVFNLAGCPACENRQAAERFLAVRRRVQAVAAEVLRTDLAVAAGMDPESVGNAADRRSFLSSLRAGLATITQQRDDSHAPLQPKATGRRIPVKVRIIDRLLTEAEPEKRAQLQALCSNRLTAGPACTGCPLCTGICPTGALRINGSGAEKQLLFIETRCSGCGLCVSFCRQAALSLSFSPLSGREPGDPAVSDKLISDAGQVDCGRSSGPAAARQRA
jgi:ferredoxin